MFNKMETLEDMLALASKYTSQAQRPAFCDLLVYDYLVDMYNSDYEYNLEPDFLWRKKPDDIMQIIVDSNYIFSLEYGMENLQDEIRDYLTNNDFVVHADDVSDEEYQTNLEGK